MTLQRKISLLALGITCLTIVLVTVLAREVVSRRSIRDVGELGREFLGRAIPVLSSGLVTRNENSLLPSLHAIGEEADALYVYVVDLDGVVVAHTNVGKLGERMDSDVLADVTRVGDTYMQRRLVERRPVLDVVVPLWVEPKTSSDEDFLLTGTDKSRGRKVVGSAWIGMPLGAREESDERMVLYLAAVVAIPSALGLGGILLAVGRVLAPLQALSWVTREIGRGNFATRAPEESSDEIGRTAASINRMSEELASTTVSRNFLESVVKNMEDALLVTDRAGSIRMVNPSAIRMTERLESELTGTSIRDLLERSDSGVAAGGGEKVLDQGYLEGSSDQVMLGATGRKCHVIVSQSRLFDWQGHHEGYVVLARDMTDRRKMERALMQAQKLSAVGQLAAGVSHEINNPIGVILGFAQSLRKRLEENSPFFAPVAAIEREAIRCRELIQNLLTFSRAANVSGSEKGDLNESVTGALALVQMHRRLKRADIQLVVDLSPDLPPAFFNRSQIQQVVVNLCNNGIDSVAEEGRVLVKTRRHSEKYLSLEIVDNGTGIPEADAQRIFEPFFTTKEVGKGTGLGLAMVHEIVQRHGGRVEVDSEQGCGTTMRVLLPVDGARADSSNKESNLGSEFADAGRRKEEAESASRISS